MRYFRFIGRSPKLLLQLLLVVLLAGFVGGAGLAGLFTTRSTATDITTREVPGLVYLLSAQRDITQVNFYGVSALIDPSAKHQAQVELPQIRTLSASAVQDFQHFAAIAGHDPQFVPAPLMARTGTLLAQWRALSMQAQKLGTNPMLTHAATTYAAFTTNVASVVDPLVRDLDTLIALQEREAASENRSVDTTTRNATVLLLAVIVVAVLLAGVFQVVMAVRDHLRKAVIRQSTDLVLIFDANGIIRSATASCERILGYAPAALVGRSSREFTHPDDLSVVRAAWPEALRADHVDEATDYRFRHADGTYHWLSSTTVNRLRDPLIGGIVVTSRDITARKQSDLALAFQASHDALTQLPNRVLFQERVTKALAADGAAAVSGSVLLLDLDHFKEVNDTLGHAVGDELLQEAGRRLVEAPLSSGLVARLGGDEFGLLVSDTDAAGAIGLANWVLGALEPPFLIADQTLEIGASIGIAHFPAHGHDPQLLLQRADVAMYIAKRRHCGIMTYDADFDQHSVQRLALSRELRVALQEDQLFLEYQPKLDPKTGAATGVEALVRWHHPSLGALAPDQFIPLAEQSGSIGQLTRWVVDRAMRQCRAWKEAGHSLTVAVNLSARDLQDQQLPEVLAELLADHHCMPSMLTLEITEGSLIAEPERAKEVLARLHGLGVQISIDDFGTGYSSLQYLKDLPVDEVKIDRVFVQGMARSSHTKDAAIVRSVIALAHSLNLRVVAEGVEDAATQACLTALDCDVLQGYLISRPVSAAGIERWLRSVQRWSALPADLQMRRVATPHLSTSKA